MWGYGYDPGWGGWLMMVFGNILWIALLGILVWAVIRWFERKARFSGQRGSSGPMSDVSALEILRQRYARGEIDAATFENMRERLEVSGVSNTQQFTGKPSSLR